MEKSEKNVGMRWMTTVGIAFVLGSVGYDLIRKMQMTNRVDKCKIRITDLIVYPIKSCKGVHLNQCEIIKTGLNFDRQYIIVNSKTQPIRLKLTPKLSLLQPSLPNANGITLNAPNMPSIDVPLIVPKTDSIDEKKSPQIRTINVLGESGVGIDQGDTVGKWLGQYLEMSDDIRLFYIHSGYIRKTPSKHTPKHLIGSGQTSFSNFFPILVASNESLKELNYRLNFRYVSQSAKQRWRLPLTMDRFRPNIVVSSGDKLWPHFEDNIRYFTVNMRQSENSEKERKYYSVKPCTRCPIPTIDMIRGRLIPAIGDMKKEPLLTLDDYRTAEQMGFDKQFNIGAKQQCFGMNLIFDECGDVITVGDTINPVWNT